MGRWLRRFAGQLQRQTVQLQAHDKTRRRDRLQVVPTSPQREGGASPRRHAPANDAIGHALRYGPRAQNKRHAPDQSQVRTCVRPNRGAWATFSF